ncbi:M28 family peptidase [Aquidulcibacter sp.]|uniref:M28 family peptidase n=1 Tax=Aquidulcibacter sp. TaxID=2052990 RepID=UPI003BA42693
MTQTHRPARPSIQLMLGLLALLLAFCFKGGLTAPPSISETLATTGFDTKAAIGRLTRILGDERPHPVDSPANDLVRERILSEIKTLGYTPEVRDDFACRGSKRFGGMSCARVRNILFRAGPSGGGAALIASHYDSVPAGPGAGDDGAGVAATLEIAARLAGRKLSKPVIFLITDGEEVGLLGATSFVRKDPWAKDVSFAINMEARGTGGPAIMFQTSMPNGRDIAALTAMPVRTIANSMAADIYRTLPNDTDATEFLGKSYDVVNFAFINPVARYHTPRDSLAYLEHASVGHMGGAALAALEGHLAAKPEANAPEAQVIYSDVLGRFMLVLPVAVGYALLGFGLLAALFAYVRSGPTGAARAMLAPLVALLVAGGVGFGALWLIDQMRVESQWWFATPMAGRALVYSSGLLGALLALWLCRGIVATRVLAGAWIWVTGLFLALSIVSPGSMILAAPSAGIAGIGFLLTATKVDRGLLLKTFGLAAAFVLMVFILPALDFAEVGLGLGLGWAFGAVGALLMLCALVPVWQPSTKMAGVSFLTLVVVSSTLVWAVFAKAYSPDIPRPLNVQHWHGGEAENAWVLGPGDEAAPSPMQAIAPFKLAPLKNGDGKRVHATAPVPTGATVPARIEILSETKSAEGRILKLRVLAPGADEVVLSIPKEAQVRRLSGGANGESGGVDFDKPQGLGLRCVGRSCVQWDLEVTLGTTPASWITFASVRGLGPEATPLIKARPPWASPVQGGDKRVTNQSQKI